ncbi:MAG: hypothetical protein P8L77_03180 [Gammaproteobacteria bacterium]|nr:hypothetical protein [Gammaproteobacteria bacterium]
MSYTNEQIENLFNKEITTNYKLTQSLVNCYLRKRLLEMKPEVIKKKRLEKSILTIVSVEVIALIFFSSVILAAAPANLYIFIAAAGCLSLYILNQYFLSNLKTYTYLDNKDAHMKISLNILFLFTLPFFPQLCLMSFLLQCLTAWSIHNNLFLQFKQKYQEHIHHEDVLYQSHYQVTKNDLNTFLTKSIDETNDPTSVAQEIPANSLFRQPDVQNSQNDHMNDNDLNQIMTSILNSESIKELTV